jgi:hypothetical protein
MSFGVPVRNGLGIGLLPSTAVSTLRIGGRPALLLNFVNTTALDSRITFTRATTATVTGSNGVIQSSAINDPRFDYDPVTLASKGLLIEEQRINLLLNSLIDGTTLSTQSVTVAAVPHTISFYGTGTITLTGASAATVTGTGVYPNRQTLTFTPIVGLLVCTVTGSVQYAQLEAGSFATSFIPTAGAAVTRSADNAVMTGTNFSSWYNQAAGTLGVVLTLNPGLPSTGNRALTMSSAGGNDRVVDINATTNWVSYNGTTNISSGVAAATSTSVVKIVAAYATGNYALAVNGNAPGTASSAVVNTATRITIGSYPAASNYLNGHIRQITFYNTRLPNATLQTLTA